MPLRKSQTTSSPTEGEERRYERRLNFARQRGGLVAWPTLNGHGQVKAYPVTSFRPEPSSVRFYDCTLVPTGNPDIWKAVPVSLQDLKPNESVSMIECFGKDLTVAVDREEVQDKRKSRYVLLRYKGGAYVHIRDGATAPTPEEDEETFLLGTTNSLAYVLIGRKSAETEAELMLTKAGTRDPLDLFIVQHIPFSYVEGEIRIGDILYALPEHVLQLAPAPRRGEINRWKGEGMRTAHRSILLPDKEVRIALLQSGQLTATSVKEAAASKLHVLKQFHPDRLKDRTDVRDWARRRIKQSYGLMVASIEYAQDTLLAWIEATEAIARLTSAAATATAERREQKVAEAHRPKFSVSKAQTAWLEALRTANAQIRPPLKPESLQELARKLAFTLQMTPGQLHSELEQASVQLNSCGVPMELWEPLWTAATGNSRTLLTEPDSAEKRQADLVKSWANWLRKRKVPDHQELAQAIAPAANCKPDQLQGYEATLIVEILSVVENEAVRNQIIVALGGNAIPKPAKKRGRQRRDDADDDTVEEE